MSCTKWFQKNITKIVQAQWMQGGSQIVYLSVFFMACHRNDEKPIHKVTHSKDGTKRYSLRLHCTLCCVEFRLKKKRRKIVVFIVLLLLLWHTNAFNLHLKFNRERGNQVKRDIKRDKSKQNINWIIIYHHHCEMHEICNHVSHGWHVKCKISNINFEMPKGNRMHTTWIFFPKKKKW